MASVHPMFIVVSSLQATFDDGCFGSSSVGSPVRYVCQLMEKSGWNMFPTFGGFVPLPFVLFSGELGLLVTFEAPDPYLPMM